MTAKLNEALGDLSNLLNKLSSKSIIHSADFVEFSASSEKNNIDRGLVWTGNGANKHFVLKAGNKFSSTESIEIIKDRAFMINGTSALSEKELGINVIKSNLREVGRLKNLTVDGNVVINEYLFYNGIFDRLGLGTDTPNAALSVAEDGVEITIGTVNASKARIGTFGSHDLELSTDNVPRVFVEKTGNITLGNKAYGPIQTKVHGKLYVGVNSIDTRVDLHVDGAVKFQEHIHQYAAAVPVNGDYRQGDIVWNSEPALGKCVGWVCVRTGTPGGWLPFGEIKHK